MLTHWVVTFLGNLAGSLFIVTIITGYGGVFDSAGYKKEAISFAIWWPTFAFVSLGMDHVVANSKLPDVEIARSH